MPFTPSVTEAFPCKRCAPPGIQSRQGTGCIARIRGGRRPQGTSVPFPPAAVSPREGRAPGPQRRRGWAGSSRQRAPGRMKARRACGRHPRRPFLPIPARLDVRAPPPRGAWSARGAESSAAHGPRRPAHGEPRHPDLPVRPLTGWTPRPSLQAAPPPRAAQAALRARPPRPAPPRATQGGGASGGEAEAGAEPVRRLPWRSRSGCAPLAPRPGPPAPPEAPQVGSKVASHARPLRTEPRQGSRPRRAGRSRKAAPGEVVFGAEKAKSFVPPCSRVLGKTARRPPSLYTSLPRFPRHGLCSSLGGRGSRRPGSRESPEWASDQGSVGGQCAAGLGPSAGPPSRGPVAWVPPFSEGSDFPLSPGANLWGTERGCP